jgi:hypothetical protein
VDPFQTHYFSENLVALGIEPGPRDLYPETLTTRPQRRSHLLKLQRLQNKVLRTIGNFPRRTQIRELHKVFNIPYIYDCMTLCRQQAEVTHNHGNANVCNIRLGEARHRKYKRLKLGGVQSYDRSSVKTAVVA